MNTIKPLLQRSYAEQGRVALQKQLGLKNIMEVPRLTKIVINIGLKDAVTDSKAMDKAVKKIAVIAQQAPVVRRARKSIAGFKIREGMEIGACVTLRNERMYDFLQKLIHLALPRVRDFQGVPSKLDGQGNYNLGLKEWIIFPEVDDNGLDKVHGFNITICTSTKNDAHARALLTYFGMPFEKENVKK